MLEIMVSVVIRLLDCYGTGYCAAMSLMMLSKAITRDVPSFPPHEFIKVAWYLVLNTAFHPFQPCFAEIPVRFDVLRVSYCSSVHECLNVTE